LLGKEKIEEGETKGFYDLEALLADIQNTPFNVES